MRRNRLVLIAVMALALATLACNALASRFQPAQPPAPQGPTPTPGAPEPTPGPAGQSPLKIGDGPTIGAPRETRVAVEEQTQILEQLAEEQYDQDALAVVGETFTFTIQLDESKRLLWVFGWCAASADLVEQNLQGMTVEFSVNGTPVDLGQFHVVDGQSGDLPCRYYLAVVYDWPSGPTQLEVRVTFNELVNDGLSEYPSGSQWFIYDVTAP